MACTHMVLAAVETAEVARGVLPKRKAGVCVGRVAARRRASAVAAAVGIRSIRSKNKKGGRGVSNPA